MRLLSIILSICLIYSATFAKTYFYKQNDLSISKIDELKKLYPEAKFVAIPMKEFLEYQKKGVQKITIEDKELLIASETTDNVADKNTPTSYNTSSNLSASGNLHFNDFFEGINGEALYIVLVVVGVFVVAAVVVDGLLILGDVVFSDKKIDKWFKLGLTASIFSYENENTKLKRDSAYGGLLISTGLKRENGGIGVVSEFGHLDLSISEKSTKKDKLYGAYALIGPTFRHFFSQKSNFHIDIMAGSSDLRQVDIMGVARVGLNFAISQHIFLDFNYGVNYLGLKKITDGYIDENVKINQNYNQIFGISFGFTY